MMNNETIFRSIGPESIQAMAVLGNSRELENILKQGAEEKEEFDMCEALRAWAAEAEEKGRTEGKIEGIAEEKINSIRIFVEDNLTESIPKSRILEKLQRYFDLSPEEAAGYFKQFGSSVY